METKEMLERLGRDDDEIEALENDPTFQFQLAALQAMKDARGEGVPYLALEYRLQDVLYGMYTLAAQSGELEDDDLLGDGEPDEQTLLLVDLVGSARRALAAGVDEDAVESALEDAFDVATDEEALAQFYDL